MASKSPKRSTKKSAETTSTSDDAASKASRDEERRASVVDRRSGLDRRGMEAWRKDSGDGAGTNLERRRGPGRRRTDFMRSAEEGEMTQEQYLFIMAIDVFKRVNNKTFPTWTDVLEVIRKLGYRKTQASTLNLGGRAEDWIERPDAPCNVTKVTPAEDEEESHDQAA